MSSVTITYGSKTFVVERESAVHAFCFAQVAALSNKTIMRNLELSDGRRASILLGPGCPIVFEADDDSAFQAETLELMPDVVKHWTSAPA